MRARDADREGYVDSRGVKLHYEIHGAAGPTILLLPTWTIIHKRFWKAQVPYLARHHRVVTYDGPGNGLSARPLDTEAYGHDRQVQYALDVLDATGTDRAVVVGLSMGACWGLQLAAEHGDRVLGSVLVGASVPLTDAHGARVGTGSPGDLPPSRVRLVQRDPVEHWAKYDPAYWQHDHEDFLWFFFGMCFPERHSTKPIEDCVAWGLDTSPDVLVAEAGASWPSRETTEQWCRAITSPVLVIHGDRDLISPLSRGERIAELTGGRLVTIEGGGHIPLARDPVKVNHLVRDFAGRFGTPSPERWSRGRTRPKRVLYLSSPIGLGHARRDVAIAAALRQRHDGIQIDWLAEHPVTRVLADAGERLHPASRWLASESRHIELESGEHDLNAYQAIRRMDEVLIKNFMIFQDAVEGGDYDLVIADEAWDIDHYWHEHPELKKAGLAWFTDFVGFVPMPSGGEREAFLTADYNAEMIEHVERHPGVRDRAIFVGGPEDIVPLGFGRDLPEMRDWIPRHFDFSGYVLGRHPRDFGPRAELRQRLGYRPDERVCIVTVGGSSVGTPLIRRILQAWPEVHARMPDLRMVLVAGPRIDPASLGVPAGVEAHAFVPDLDRHLAACDLALVQGGLTTCMELTAAGTPFLYFPLKNHFEQNIHVAHRLERYAAGRRMEFATATPQAIADAMIAELARPAAYKPVEADGAARAARMLAEFF